MKKQTEDTLNYALDIVLAIIFTGILLFILANSYIRFAHLDLDSGFAYMFSSIVLSIAFTSAFKTSKIFRIFFWEAFFIHAIFFPLVMGGSFFRNTISMIINFSTELIIILIYLGYYFFKRKKFQLEK